MSKLNKYLRPRFLCKARRTAIDALPKVYGPRGTIMLGKGFICLCFGLAYIGVLKTSPSPGLELVTRLMPLPLWAVVWFITGFMLIAAAFRVDHSRALGMLTAMLSLWSLTYLDYYFRVPVLPNGNDNTAYLFAAIMAGMALSAAGVARMLNHGKSHAEIILAPGEVVPDE
jgi:4-hydroxybenzoate polyprenyltransferase